MSPTHRVGRRRFLIQLFPTAIAAQLLAVLTSDMHASRQKLNLDEETRWEREILHLRRLTRLLMVLMTGEKGLLAVMSGSKGSLSVITYFYP
jgi:hypothetical protein